ncbi:MAG TPA: DUF6286 domain-containing protein [Mycobacterium sp.]|nr:DUF6286 domain-containing protein [Mycobacterium sp.]
MRLINRPLGALLGVAIAAAGVLVVVEVAADRLIGRPVVVQWHRIYDWAEHTNWTQGSVRAGSVLIAILGIVLLLAELRRDAPRRYPVSGELTDAAFTRHGIEAAIRCAVTDVDGIADATVKVTRRNITVAATAVGRQPETAQSLSGPVADAARHRLDALELCSPPPLSVRVGTRSR